ncbi:hypothetical protein [Chroococcidiopsis sp.]|uniref:hypothetical protein n=1 Tax=Chroococcidiopsis sp. TaxID=3088168 RepID=UPI003F66A843
MLIPYSEWLDEAQQNLAFKTAEYDRYHDLLHRPQSVRDRDFHLSMVQILATTIAQTVEHIHWLESEIAAI